MYRLDGVGGQAAGISMMQLQEGGEPTGSIVGMSTSSPWAAITGELNRRLILGPDDPRGGKLDRQLARRELQRNRRAHDRL